MATSPEKYFVTTAGPFETVVSKENDLRGQSSEFESVYCSTDVDHKTSGGSRIRPCEVGHKFLRVFGRRLFILIET